MMGQEGHGTDKRIADNLAEKKDNFYLFFREKHHTSFIYYGKCALLSASINTEKPSEFEFLLLEQNNEYDDEEEIINYLVNIDVAFDDTVTPPIIVEGAKKVSKHVRYERNPKNRKEAIKIHGCRCQMTRHSVLDAKDFSEDRRKSTSELSLSRQRLNSLKYEPLFQLDIRVSGIKMAYEKLQNALKKAQRDNYSYTQGKKG